MIYLSFYLPLILVGIVALALPSRRRWWVAGFFFVVFGLALGFRWYYELHDRDFLFRHPGVGEWMTLYWLHAPLILAGAVGVLLPLRARWWAACLCFVLVTLPAGLWAYVVLGSDKEFFLRHPSLSFLHPTLLVLYAFVLLSFGLGFAGAGIVGIVRRWCAGKKLTQNNSGPPTPPVKQQIVG